MSPEEIKLSMHTLRKGLNDGLFRNHIKQNFFVTVEVLDSEDAKRYLFVPDLLDIYIVCSSLSLFFSL